MSLLHHVAVIARRMDRAVRFFQDILGLTLVQRTVNIDDPYTPVLIFGDRQGTPSTQVHVFIYPKCVRATPGVGAATSVAFRVAKGSLRFWKERIGKARMTSGALHLRGCDGLPVCLVEAEAVTGWTYDQRSPVDRTNAVRGLLSVEVMVDAGGQKFWDDLAWSEVRPVVGTQKSALGYGAVHHLAFSGQVTEPIFDREDYRSSYFYDPCGLLCEVVAQGPERTADNSEERPQADWYFPSVHQSRRAEIERVIRSMS